MDDFAAFTAFLETEGILKHGVSMDDHASVSPAVPEDVPVDMEVIRGASSYSWCVVA